jgi:hypothetical protein
LKTLPVLPRIDSPPPHGQDQQATTDDNFQRRENQVTTLVCVNRPAEKRKHSGQNQTNAKDPKDDARRLPSPAYKKVHD